MLTLLDPSCKSLSVAKGSYSQSSYMHPSCMQPGKVVWSCELLLSCSLYLRRLKSRGTLPMNPSGTEDAVDWAVAQEGRVLLGDLQDSFLKQYSCTIQLKCIFFLKFVGCLWQMWRSRCVLAEATKMLAFVPLALRMHGFPRVQSWSTIPHYAFEEIIALVPFQRVSSGRWQVSVLVHQSILTNGGCFGKSLCSEGRGLPKAEALRPLSWPENCCLLFA